MIIRSYFFHVGFINLNVAFNLNVTLPVLVVDIILNDTVVATPILINYLTVVELLSNPPYFPPAKNTQSFYPFVLANN